ncbi:Cof-type HAD-IIB family hydrolase [Companilactobacillus jidongensis]|uniref:Cof-type HAD-IIB family hydrolase n=1 Tax=Companilactobacillus jidongensis TaxID=2486006 RepID=UPI0013DDF141|nr:HAD family hydrolase [Companilactobacillus jidongensis]
MIKMIATDMDGTFLDDYKEFDNDHFDFLNTKFEKENIKFVVASGNQYQQLLHYFNNDYSNQTYIAENGALIINDGKIIFEKILTKEQLSNILTLLSKIKILKGAIVVLSGRKGAYVANSISEKSMKETRKYYQNIIKVDDLKNVDDKIYKVSLNWIDQDTMNKENVLNAEVGDVHITSGGFGGLDIVPENINKGTALEYLQDLWNIDKGDTAAFGDNYNDFELLNTCDFGFAMKNANEYILNSSKYVTEFDNNDDGVLRTIDMLV